MTGLLKGLYAVTAQGTAPRLRPFVTSAAVFEGAPVEIDTNGLIACQDAADTAGLLVGVASHFTASGGTCLVYTDPDQEYVTTPDAAFTNQADAMANSYQGVGFATQNGTTGRSNFQLNEAAASTTVNTTNAYKVLRLFKKPGNEWANVAATSPTQDNAWVVVKINPVAHFFGTAAAGI